MEQPLADRIEDLALRLRHNPGRRHLNVSLVDSIQVLTTWRDDLRMRQASIETALHDAVRVPSMPILLRPRCSMARLTSEIMSITGSGDKDLKSAMQK